MADINDNMKDLRDVDSGILNVCNRGQIDLEQQWIIMFNQVMNGLLPAIPDKVCLPEKADLAPGTHYVTTGFYKAETPEAVCFT